MNRHIDDAGLNDYLEGLASEDVARHVDQHVAECAECSGRLRALTALVSELAELPHDAQPANDLWSGVRAGIDAGSGRDDTDIGPVSRGRSDRNRRFSFSAPQLAAASLVLALLSSGTTWMALNSRPDQATVAVSDVVPLAGAPAESGNILPVTHAATTEYEQAIARLESILEQGRDQLDPRTVETIEASLATIDRAIEEARGALADDPNNRSLNRLLIKYEQSKLRVLRQASAAVQI